MSSTYCPQLYTIVRNESLQHLQQFLDRQRITGESKVEPNPLSVALNYKRVDMILFLMDAGYKLYSGSLLVEAASMGLDFIIEKILSNPSSVKTQTEERNEIGNTALIEASIHGHVSIVQRLLRAKAYIHAVDQTGYTSLHWACFKGNLAVVQALLDGGAKVDYPDQNHSTPLMIASHYNHAPIVELLVDRGANPDLVDQMGRTAFDWGASSEIKIVLFKHSSAHHVPSSSIAFDEQKSNTTSPPRQAHAAIPATPQLLQSQFLSPPQSRTPMDQCSARELDSPMFSPFDPFAGAHKTPGRRAERAPKTPATNSKLVWKSHLLDTAKMQRLLNELDDDIYRKKKELHNLMTSSSSISSSVTSTPHSATSSFRTNRKIRPDKSDISNILKTSSLDKPGDCQSPFSFLLNQSKESIQTPEHHRLPSSHTITTLLADKHLNQSRAVDASLSSVMSATTGKTMTPPSSVPFSDSRHLLSTNTGSDVYSNRSQSNILFPISPNDRSLSQSKGKTNDEEKSCSLLSVSCDGIQPESEEKENEKESNISNSMIDDEVIEAAHHESDESIISSLDLWNKQLREKLQQTQSTHQPPQPKQRESSPGTSSTTLATTTPAPVISPPSPLTIYPPLSSQDMSLLLSPPSNKVLRRLLEQYNAEQQEQNDEASIEQKQEPAIDLDQMRQQWREEAEKQHKVEQEQQRVMFQTEFAKVDEDWRKTCDDITSKLSENYDKMKRLEQQIEALLKRGEEERREKEMREKERELSAQKMFEDSVHESAGKISAKELDQSREEEEGTLTLSPLHALEEKSITHLTLSSSHNHFDHTSDHLIEHSHEHASPIKDTNSSYIDINTPHYVYDGRREIIAGTEEGKREDLRRRRRSNDEDDENDVDLRNSSSESQLIISRYKSEQESLQQQLSSYFEQYESLELYCYELQNELKETKEAFQYKLASYHRLKRTNKMLDHLASDRLSALSTLRHVTTVRDSRSFYLMLVFICQVVIWALLAVIVYLYINKIPATEKDSERVLSFDLAAIVEIIEQSVKYSQEFVNDVRIHLILLARDNGIEL